MSLLILGLIVLAAGWWGNTVIAWLRLPLNSRLQRFWIAQTLGLLLFGTTAAIVGRFDLSGTTCWSFFGLALVSGWIVNRRFPAVKSEVDPSPATPLAHPLWWIPLGVAVVLAGITALLSQAPNVYPDPMVHHFLVPDLWLQAGYLSELPQVPYSYFPALLQTLSAFGMALAGEAGASLISWYLTTLLVLGVGSAARQWWRPEAGIASALVLLSWETFTKHWMGGWADTGIALFVLLGVVGLAEWRRDSRPGWIVIAGLGFGGGLAASKHTGMLPAAMAIVTLFIWLGFPRSPATWGNLARLLTAMLVPASFWYARSAVLTGNPVYPLTFWGLFPGPEVAIYTESQWANAGFARSPLSLLQHPLLITFGEKAWPEAFQGRLPWQWILGVPLAIGFAWRDPTLRWLGALLAATWVAMLLLAPTEVRYFLFAVPWLALVSGVGLAKLCDTDARPALTATLVTLVLVIPALIRAQPLVGEWQLRWPVLIGERTRADYIQKSNHPAAMVVWCNANLDPQTDRIFALEDRLYRLRIPWTNYFAQQGAIPTDPAGCLAYLHAAKATHLLLGEGHIWEPSVLAAALKYPSDADGVIWVTQSQVMQTLLDEPIHAQKHWVLWVLFRRQAERAGWGHRRNAYDRPEYGIPRAQIEGDPGRMAALGVLRAFRELIDTGALTVVYTDGVNLVLEVGEGRDTLSP